MIVSKIDFCFVMVLICVIENASARPANNKELLAPPKYIQHQASPNSVQIAVNGKTAIIAVDAGDWKGVIRAANDLGDVNSKMYVHVRDAPSFESKFSMACYTSKSVVK